MAEEDIRPEDTGYEDSGCENEENGYENKESGQNEGTEAEDKESTVDGAEQGAGEDPAVEEADEENAGDAAEEPEAVKNGDAEDSAGKEAGGKKEKRPFRHRKELEKKDQEIAELKDRLLRQMAEFENYRKRTEKEKASRFDDGAAYILEKLLPVIDNFERGIGQIPEEKKSDPYAEGLEKIYKQFAAMLEDAGVKAMDAAGKPFDPNLHNAVMHVDDEALGENTVAEEFQKGYTYRERVLRHAMVKVAN